MNNILITGVTSGIGFDLASRLLKYSDYIIWGIGRNEDKISNLKEYSNFRFLKFDLNNIELYEDFFAECFDKIKFNGFVHCAGIEETIPLLLQKPDATNTIFKINLFSAVELLRIISKKKYSVDGASFIFISSVMGKLGQPGKVGYCSTKAAILGMVRAAALELSKRKIRVNAISPGIVDTPLTQKLFSKLDEESIQKIINMHPLGIGAPNKISPLIEFLLNNDSSWITGQNIVVDGGYSIQ